MSPNEVLLTLNYKYRGTDVLQSIQRIQSNRINESLSYQDEMMGGEKRDVHHDQLRDGDAGGDAGGDTGGDGWRQPGLLLHQVGLL